MNEDFQDVGRPEPEETPQREPLPPCLVVGLGNPGARYRQHRHNIGFMVLDHLADRLNLEFLEQERAYTAAAGNVADEALVLLKPLTYMNLSGEAVAAWLEKHGHAAHPERILVVCDDLALPLGTVRLRGKGSSGGQNGLASVIDHLQTEGFPRLRLGIDASEGSLEPEAWPEYVLADFPAEEQAVAEALVRAGAAAVLSWVENGLERTASRCNGPVSLP